MQCTKCGAKMDFSGKDTFSGREIREYRCRACGHDDSEDTGQALWEIMHEARVADDVEAREKAIAEAKRPVAWLRRLFQRLRRS
jgi:hypothetical protein